MTRELRQRHRRITLTLAVLVTVAFIVGIMVRRPVPVMSGSTGPLGQRASQPAPR
jgi:hypothetical protein